MLSPRTMSLRMKNRILLKALEKYTDQVVENTSAAEQQQEGGYDAENIYHQSSGFDPCDEDVTLASTCIPPSYKYLLKPDTKPRNVLQLYDSSNSQHNDKIPFEYTLNTSCESKQKLSYQTEKIEKIVHEIVSETQGDTPYKLPGPCIIKKKNDSSRNPTTTNVKAVQCRTISAEQQRAAVAQMHAPTHSHSLSKCYCVDINNIHTQPDNKYVVQVYGRKQHIPSRLKRQRYRADSISKHSRTVRWADFNDQVENLHSEMEDQVSLLVSQKQSEISNNPLESDETSSFRQFPSHYHHESETSLIDKVKTIRDSHWSDCHASAMGKTLPSDHECVQHYVLNKRSFLEPLHMADNGDGSCPVCSLSSEKPMHDHESINQLVAHDNHSRHVMVTLPTLILEPSQMNRPLKTSTRRKEEAFDSELKKPCYSVAHHRQQAKGSVPHPSDSLALRYQKKAY